MFQMFAGLTIKAE